MAAAAESPRPPAVIVLARAPQRGRVKTRLAATVGDDEALAVHRSLLGRTAALAAGLVDACAASGAVAELCIAGEDPLGECSDLAARYGMRITRQQGLDLGERMHSALAAALRAGHLPLLLGSDCPALAVRDLLDALAALQGHDAVFAPAEDGGYALVGLRRECPWLFQGPAWGGPEVMAQTRALMRARRLRWAELRTVWDVDTHADYLRWRALDDAAS
ncbi:MAG TPA: TIGR04282 family arsenosugar biosynthesis glycosyltransferase [Quisquiliibacterium sp.]|nr:TIGR04282 family arsenosugar biosynthesis glycosyltransferase [Quisquiliibacterium sp.]